MLIIDDDDVHSLLLTTVTVQIVAGLLTGHIQKLKYLCYHDALYKLVHTQHRMELIIIIFKVCLKTS